MAWSVGYPTAFEEGGIPIRLLVQGIKWCAVFGVVFFLATAAAFLLPVDRQTFRAALTQPLLYVRNDATGLLPIACNCDKTLAPHEVPEHVRAALIATEDRRFYYHPGVDILSLGRAILDGGQRGGSTLAMQLARNAFTGYAPTRMRKLVEIQFALRIEHAYSKDDVVRLYLSRVNFGRLSGVPVYGLRAAAQGYFGKPPQDLSLPEAAILVGMLNAPSAYHPIRNPEAATRRAELVLRRLRSAGYGPAEGEIALAGHMPDRVRVRPDRDRYLEDALLRELRPLRADLPQGVLRVLSTIDPIAQEQARRLVRREAKRFVGRGVERAALLSMDGQGRILAVFGGLNYRKSAFNLAIQAHRQAASAAKIATYLAALEQGWSPQRQVRDDRDAIKGPFVPRNSDYRYKGRIPMRQCIVESRNVCTMWLAQQVGMTKVSEMAHRIGLTETRMPGSSVVLGAAETTLPQMAAAYATIANGGQKVQPTLLRAVLGGLGRVAYVPPDPVPDPVLAPDIALAMKALLGQVTSAGGTGHGAVFRGGVAYGKTGTSEDFRDAWFAGFSDHGIVTVVWAGPREGGQMDAVYGGDLPAQIFAFFNVNLVERFDAYAAGAAPDSGTLWRDINPP